MKNFLDIVAEDLIKRFGNDMSKVAVVFPNKRASLFLNDALLRQAGGKAVWAPSYFTISQLFRQWSDLSVCDDIMLVVKLYKSYIKVTGEEEETLDQFFPWGQLMLADFDDIDKNMAEATQIFKNLANYHEYDNIDYLSEEQKALLQAFFRSFNAENGNSALRKRFLNIWSKMGDIYTDFHQRLRKDQTAYEGMLYRDVVETADIEAMADFDHYAFVGFNVLQKVEFNLFRQMRAADKALFYWDIDKEYIDPKRKSLPTSPGFFIKQYLEELPSAVELSDENFSNLKRPKDITFLSSATENLQARYVSEWLKENNRYAEGKKTAIVMCDEALLQTIVHSIPPETGELNITAGYPLQQSAIASFVNALLTMQTAGWNPRHNDFMLHWKMAVQQHPCFEAIENFLRKEGEKKELEEGGLSDGKEAKIGDKKEANGNGKVVSLGDAFVAKWREEVFYQIVKSNNSGTPLVDLSRWIISIVQLAGQTQQDDPFNIESTYRIYKILNRLDDLINVKNDNLKIECSSYQRLVKYLIQQAKVPFHGEPAVGVQVMGVLETRNIDFDHLLLLSCNDAKMPGVSDSTSFIPYNIRKAFGLTTVEHKVAVFSYYFYRLMQRATDISIAYNSGTSNGQTGERSRFMLQLMTQPGINVKFAALKTGSSPLPVGTREVEKDEEVMKKIKKIMSGYRVDKDGTETYDRAVSPSSLNKYLQCPLQYYFRYVKGIAEPDDLEDENDFTARHFGDVFHHTFEELYGKENLKGNVVDARYIKALLDELKKSNGSSPSMVERTVNKMISKELEEAYGSAPKALSGLQLINKEVIITYVRNTLEYDLNYCPITIKGLEAKFYRPFSVNIAGNVVEGNIGGIIDRLDSVVDKETGEHVIRVVDYKTGKFGKDHPNNIDEVFDPQNVIKKHAGYYLQTFLYSDIISEKENANGGAHKKVRPCLLFAQHLKAQNYDITLQMKEERLNDKGRTVMKDVNIDDIADYHEPFNEHLQMLLNEICDPSVPFRPTADEARCQWCPYVRLCKK